jgi:hypothetical protein
MRRASVKGTGPRPVYFVGSMAQEIAHHGGTGPLHRLVQTGASEHRAAASVNGDRQGANRPLPWSRAPQQVGREGSGKRSCVWSHANALVRDILLKRGYERTETTSCYQVTWVKGQSGNPAGRPKGSKHKLQTSFWHDLHRTWKERGVEGA